MSRIRTIGFITLLLTFPVIVNAVGVGARPTTLEIAGQVRQVSSAEVLVLNTGDEPALYEVTADAFASEFVFTPAVFSLDPNGTQLVKVEVKPTVTGTWSTHISVVAHPYGSQLTAASGIKIAVHVQATGIPAWQQPFLWGIVGALGLGLIGMVYYRRKKRYEHRE